MIVSVYCTSHIHNRFVSPTVCLSVPWSTLSLTHQGAAPVVTSVCLGVTVRVPVHLLTVCSCIERHCDESICLFACITPKPLGQTSLVSVHVMVRSSSGSNAIRYVVLVLWMTSYFQMMALWCIMCIPK